MQVEDIFEVEKENEKESFNDVGNKMLLWYVEYSFKTLISYFFILKGMDLV